MIQIVGNVIKDVYLSIDTRSTHLESDERNVKWLNLSFDTSEHHFFHRLSTFGGAAVTLEVLSNLGLSAAVNGSKFSLKVASRSAPVANYRYILTEGDSASYLTPVTPRFTTFKTPSIVPSYLFIDRSAYLTDATISAIKSYLRLHPEIRLILHLKNLSLPQATLASDASLVFTEVTPEAAREPSSSPLSSIPPSNIVYLSEKAIISNSITEPLTLSRTNKRTHLSLYSILAATYFACFVKGLSTEDCLRYARLNIENSPLDSTLTLARLRHLSRPNARTNLALIAATLMTPHKGILAIDESPASLDHKFTPLSIPNDFAHRHDFRDLLFTTKGIEQYLSGIILHDETARDHMANLVAIPDYLTAHRIVPGIKVDQGLAPLGDSRESITRGLDTLPSRLQDYFKMGLRFAKWRAAFTITTNQSGDILTPTPLAIKENCDLLAAYAHECQLAGLVPILEPEVLWDGDYPIEACYNVTAKILDTLSVSLSNYPLDLSGCIYKINMIQAGKSHDPESTPSEVAKFTSTLLNTCVPMGLGGVVFLSGGQSPERATANLAAIIEHGPYPWPVSFAFARAITAPAITTWHGDSAESKKARQAFLDRLIANTSIL